ncbi:MAG: hypothetical protein LBT01_05705 [Spirochaetaceae bacterium]|jgi:hypothetical protein|nr:hypothetical protein [Spirochaetaceae bacterium]
MITSNRLTADRWEKIKQSPIIYTEDCPELSREQLLRMKPKHPENFQDKSLGNQVVKNIEFRGS